MNNTQPISIIPPKDEHDIYIINISKKVSNETIKKIGDGYATIALETYGPMLRIMSHKNIFDADNVIHVEKIINKSLAIHFSGSSDHRVKISTNYSDEYIITFDGNSGSAYRHFEKNINDKMSMRVDSIYYPSGILWMTGTFVNNMADGYGTEFYDSPQIKIKYKGEFENGKYDGAGTFYSNDGSIEVIIQNISKGVPNGDCKIIIYKPNTTEISLRKTFKYNSLKIPLDSTDIKFTNKIAEHLLTTCKFDISRKTFRDSSIDEKLNILYDKLELLLSKTQ